LRRLPFEQQVHQDAHWVIAMIDLRERKLVYYDPLQARDRIRS